MKKITSYNSCPMLNRAYVSLQVQNRLIREAEEYMDCMDLNCRNLVGPIAARLECVLLFKGNEFRNVYEDFPITAGMLFKLDKLYNLPQRLVKYFSSYIAQLICIGHIQH